MTYLYVLSRQQTAMDKIKYALFAFAMAVPVLLAAERAAQADSSEVKRRPKVGVVLSGGGAKGFAHLGAIKVMERAGIHIDYIGGTSIGAIVGGLYASGWTTGQIDSLIKDFDMSKIVTDKVERRYRQYYDKENEGKTWFRLGMKRFRPQFPTAISHGQNVINLFADWTVAMHDVDDFDSLYIPYFAKVTDLSHGTSVKLDKGYLPEAMRASGTFPSLFTPFPIDSCVFIDGGVLDNFPIDEMRRMGADIVIGVNINTGLSTPDKLGSIVSILDQIIGFQIVKNVESQLPNLDLDIKPDIEGYGVMSFNDADSIYVRGVEAAEEKFDQLLEIARKQRAFGEIPEKQRPVHNKNGVYIIEDMTVSGADNYSREYFLGRFDSDFPTPMTLDDIHAGINRLYATGNFDNVYYRLRKGKRPGMYVLNIIAREKDIHQYVGVGWSYDQLYGANLLLNLRINNILKRSIFETDLVIGQNSSLALSLFRDNGKKPSFGVNFKLGQLKTKTNFSDVSEDIFPGGSTTDPLELKLRTDIMTEYITGNFFAQKTIEQRYTAGLGVEYLYMKAYVDNISFAGAKLLTFENTYFITPYAYFSGDTRDDKFFPTKGAYFNLMYKFLISPAGDVNEYVNQDGDNVEKGGNTSSLVIGEMVRSIPVTRYFAINLDAYAGLSLGRNLPFAYRFFPGGIRSVMPFNYVEFYGLPFFWNKDEQSTDLGVNNFMKAGIKFQYSPGRNQYIYAAYNYGLISSGRNAFSAKYDSIQGMGLGYGIGTPVGPLKLTFTYSPDKTTGSNFGVFFSAGYTF